MKNSLVNTALHRMDGKGARFLGACASSGHVGSMRSDAGVALGEVPAWDARFAACTRRADRAEEAVALDGATRAARFALAALAAVALACALAWAALAPAAAYADNMLITAPTTVSDDITRIHVDKVDAGTHEWLPGAKMQIIEKATGEVVDEWITGTETHKVDKALNVNVEYILREVEAPEGYAKVGDTVFIANEMEGEGITIIQKDESTQLTEMYHVTLFDQHEAVEVETVVERDRVFHLPQTGDSTPIVPIDIAVVVATAVVVVALVARRRNR